MRIEIENDPRIGIAGASLHRVCDGVMLLRIPTSIKWPVYGGRIIGENTFGIVVNNDTEESCLDGAQVLLKSDTDAEAGFLEYCEALLWGNRYGIDIVLVSGDLLEASMDEIIMDVDLPPSASPSALSAAE